MVAVLSWDAMSTLKRCFGSCADWRRCGESVSDGNRGQGLAFDGVYGHAPGRGRVAMPFGFALTDPGGRISRTRLFPRVTRVISEPAPKFE